MNRNSVLLADEGSPRVRFGVFPFSLREKVPPYSAADEGSPRMSNRAPLLLLALLAGCWADVEIADSDTVPIIDIDCTSFCEDTSTDEAKAICYSCRCKDAMDGWLPSVEEYQCSNGEEIVIYTAGEDGELSAVDGRVTTCANPSLLYGTCVPGGRLGQLTHGDVTAKWICRRNYYTTDESAPYDDVGIILYNERTGASCWYDDSDGTGIADDNMPDMDLTKGDEANLSAFTGYYYFTTGDGCTGCHDNDPFNYTPFLQSVNWVPGAYTHGAFTRVELDGTTSSTGATHLVSQEAAACTGCHRIASASTCSSWAPDSYGAAKGAGHEDRVVEASTDAQSDLWWLATWMPYVYSGEQEKNRDDWEATFGLARDTIETCCASPGSNTDGCEWEALPE